MCSSDLFSDLEVGQKALTDNIAKEGFRYSCVIHKANWASELQGCIAFGEKLGSAKKRKSDWKDPRWMVTDRKSVV